MPYIGKSPSGLGVRTRYLYTATGSQTTFSGADTQNLTLTYSDSNFIDVYQNGVLLKIVDDYTATSGTSVVLGTGATANDVIEITVYDIFSVANHVKKSGDIMTGSLEVTTGGLTVTGDSTVTGDLTVTGNNQLKIETSTATKVGLLIESTSSTAADGPRIDMYRNSSSPADNDDIGQIQFNGNNSAGEKIMYGSIFAEIDDVTDGTENGAIVFNLEDGGGLNRMVQIGTDETVFNTNGLDINFRVESDDNTHMIFVDAGNDHVNFGTSSQVSTGSNAGTGVTIQENGRISVQADDSVDSSAVPLRIGRIGHDAGDTIVLFSTNGDARGSISESNGTVSYNAFMGSHITQSVPNDTLEGTVLESTGELIDSTDEDYEGYVQQKRLTKCKVSDTEDSNNVYGIFQTESKSGVQYASALGSYFIRVHKDETVSLGDLLSSKGDGTAKVQSDDIIRSRTIGKVTSLTKKVTHSDGSYLLPCVLYCG